MISKNIESKILWENAKFLNIDLVKYYIEFGQKVAQEIVVRNPDIETATVICGLGDNGADGLCVAYFLAERNINTTVYIIGRVSNFESPIGINVFDEIKKQQLKNIKIVQDAYAKDITQSDLVIESLVGDGFKGKTLNKRFKGVIERISHFKSHKIAIDVPTPHYNPDITYSINYAKHQTSEVINIKYPVELELFAGPGEKMFLWKPNNKTHKMKNGKLLFIGDNNLNLSLAQKYNVKVSKFSFNSKKNHSSSAIKISNSDKLDELIQSSDVILLGDTDEDIISYATINHILQKYKNKIFVLFGLSLQIAELKNFRNLSNLVLVLQNNTRNDKFTLNEANAKRFAVENSTNIALLGFQIKLFNTEGETKIFSEDFSTEDFALKTSVYATKNNLWLAMRAGLLG